MAITAMKSKKTRKVIGHKADVWVGKVKVGTKTFDTKSAAILWHDATRKAYDSGNPGSVVNGAMTFGEMIREYLQHPEGFMRLRKSSQQTHELRMP